MNIEKQYLGILENLTRAELQENRTGINAYKIPPTMIHHDMSEGFPLLTTKRVAWKTMKVELEGFIKGITSKKWFQERGCNIWNEWCCPSKVPYSNDTETLQKMKDEDFLGNCIYGASWRGFHDPTATVTEWVDGLGCNYDQTTHLGGKVDQLQNLVDTLKSNPTDRRMICMAWNPLGMNDTALPPCHVLFQVSTRGNKLDLTWYQRSNDVFLGIPFNLASYALLLHLLAKESNMEEGILTGFLTDVHLYENHLEQANEQLIRTPRDLPTIKTACGDFFNWEHGDTELMDYDPYPSIKAPVAISNMKSFIHAKK